MRTVALFLAPLLAGMLASTAQGAYKSVNPKVKEIVAAISEQRMSATLKKLESFGTRSMFSETVSETHGIGGARRWIFDELKSYSPRLQVGFDTYKVKKQGRVVRDTELVNIIAVLPGTVKPERRVVVSGHYDTALVQKSQPGDTEVKLDVTASDQLAPGVTDDGSGVAAVLELARVMSRYEFEKTLVFIAFAGEEEGLVGSTLYAAKAKQEHQAIEAVLNNDIIGSEIGGDTLIDNRRVRLFSADPNDSPSRQVARYVRDMGQRYVPAMTVDVIFRDDRFYARRRSHAL